MDDLMKEAYERAVAEYYDARFAIAAAWLSIALDAAEDVDGFVATWDAALRDMLYICPDIQLQPDGDRVRYGRWTAKGWKESVVTLGKAKHHAIKRLIGWT